MSSRSEAFLSDDQARDTYHRGRAGARRERARFLALRIRHLANMGAYIGSVGANIQTLEFRALPARHVRHPAHRHRRRAASSPTRCRPRPIAAPAGRRRTTCSSAWSRRPRASPASIRSSCGGAISSRPRRCRTRPRSAPPIDCGDFAADPRQGAGARRLRRLQAAPARSRRSAARYRGIGISCMLEHAGGMPLEGARADVPRRRAR